MRRSHLGQTSNDASREDMLRFLALGVAGAHVIADVLGSRERAWRLRRAILISPPLFPFAFGRLRASAGVFATFCAERQLRSVRTACVRRCALAMFGRTHA